MTCRAEHPCFVIPTPNGGGILFAAAASAVQTASCTQTFTYHMRHPAACYHLDLIPVLALLGIADSSAAFGLGMTRTTEQGDLESFSTNRKDRRLEIKLRDPKTAFANPPNAPAAEGPVSYSPAHARCVPFRSMKLSCRERNGRIEWRFRCRSSCPKSAR
jgi:hypothetical protein